MRRQQKKYYPVVSTSVDNMYQCAMIPTTNKHTAESEFNSYLEEITNSIYMLKSKSVFKPQTLIACPRCGNALSLLTKVYGGDSTEAICRCENCHHDNK